MCIVNDVVRTAMPLQCPSILVHDAVRTAFQQRMPAVTLRTYTCLKCQIMHMVYVTPPCRHHHKIDLADAVLCQLGGGSCRCQHWGCGRVAQLLHQVTWCSNCAMHGGLRIAVRPPTCRRLRPSAMHRCPPCMHPWTPHSIAKQQQQIDCMYKYTMAQQVIPCHLLSKQTQQGYVQTAIV
jgi:hypothetical protein